MGEHHDEYRNTSSGMVDRLPAADIMARAGTDKDFLSVLVELASPCYAVEEQLSSPHLCSSSSPLYVSHSSS